MLAPLADQRARPEARRRRARRGRPRRQEHQRARRERHALISTPDPGHRPRSCGTRQSACPRTLRRPEPSRAPWPRRRPPRRSSSSRSCLASAFAGSSSTARRKACDALSRSRCALRSSARRRRQLEAYTTAERHVGGGPVGARRQRAAQARAQRRDRVPARLRLRDRRRPGDHDLRARRGSRPIRPQDLASARAPRAGARAASWSTPAARRPASTATALPSACSARKLATCLVDASASSSRPDGEPEQKDSRERTRVAAPRVIRAPRRRAASAGEAGAARPPSAAQPGAPPSATSTAAGGAEGSDPRPRGA